MKRYSPLKTILSFVALTALLLPASAQRFRRGGPFGDWKFKVDYNGRVMQSILSFSRDANGNRTAEMINFFGVTHLKDVTFQDGQLSFTQVNRFRNQKFTSTFKGTIENGKLTGTLSNSRGEFKVEGERARRVSRIAGTWNLKLKVRDREFNSTLVISAGEPRQLTGKWQSRRGETELTDLSYRRGVLTFKRVRTYQGTRHESNFEGRIDRRTGNLTGTLKSDRGEITVQGIRADSALIGTWNLELTSDRGTRQQRLTVYPDMSGLYGAMPIKKINFEDNHATFKIVRQFGDNTFELNFKGQVADGKLTGETSTSRGTTKVTGTKVVRTFFRRRATN